MKLSIVYDIVQSRNERQATEIENEKVPYEVVGV